MVDNAHPAFQLDTKDDPSLAKRILESAVQQAAARLPVRKCENRLSSARRQMDTWTSMTAVLAAELQQRSATCRTMGMTPCILEALRRVFVRRPETASSLTAPSVLNRLSASSSGRVQPHSRSMQPVPRLSRNRAGHATAARSLHGRGDLRRHVHYRAGTWCFSRSSAGFRKGAAALVRRCRGRGRFLSRRGGFGTQATARCHRDKDRIEAVIRGCGTSSDGKGASVTEPKKEGQFLAIRRAYSAAQIDGNGAIRRGPCNSDAGR